VRAALLPISQAGLNLYLGSCGESIASLNKKYLEGLPVLEPFQAMSREEN
jgi:hypothetical protein